MTDTDRTAKNDNGRKPLNNKKDKDERLEEGLEESFPASDPVSINQPTRTGEPGELAKPKKKSPKE